MNRNMNLNISPNEQSRREMEEIGFLTDRHCLIDGWTLKRTKEKEDDGNIEIFHWKGSTKQGTSNESKRLFHPLPVLQTQKGKVTDNVTDIGVYGHDTVLVNSEKRIMVVADGHGPRGEIASQLAISVLLRYIEEERNDFSETIATIHPLLIKRVGHSGCTLTAVRVLEESNELLLEITKIGDSPVVMVMIDRITKEKRVMIDNFDHSWENKTELEKYKTWCTEKGVLPRRPIFARANCLNSDWTEVENESQCILFPRLSPDKTNQPFYLEDQKDIQEWMEIVHKQFPYYRGGCQSVRRFLDTNNSVLTGYETLNWGSTIYRPPQHTSSLLGIGSTQLTRSLGDGECHTTDYISDKPEKGIYLLPRGCDIVVLVGSDGFTDLWWYHQLGDEIEKWIGSKEMNDVNDIGKQLLQKTLETCATLDEYGIGKHGHPLHDDLSFGISFLQTSF
uniref:PPM-type phosphatase domain-containing protein n=1 Tax=viral metagenome TaxID=1070528 RepID=A0A6C0D1R6_9ZZZZ